MTLGNRLQKLEYKVFGYDNFRWRWACSEVKKALGLRPEDEAGLRADISRLDTLWAEGITGEPEPLTAKFLDKLNEYLP